MVNSGGYILGEKADQDLIDEFMEEANKITNSRGMKGNYIWMFTLQKELDKRGLKPVIGLNQEEEIFEEDE